MIDFILIVIIAAAIIAALLYIRKSSKKGIKCVGCPYAASCSSKSCDGKKE